MPKLLCCQMGIVIKHFRRLDWLSRVKGWNFREKKIFQLRLEFLKGPFLVQHFSCYTLMTFLMMLSVILLSILMILLFILSVTRHLIRGNNLNWLRSLGLIYEILWTGVRSGLLISMLAKLSWFGLTGLIRMVLLMWKCMGLFLRKNYLLTLFRMGFFGAAHGWGGPPP